MQSSLQSIMIFSQPFKPLARKLLANIKFKHTVPLTQISLRTVRRMSSTTGTDSKVSVTFVRPDGNKITVKASQNKSLYDAVIDNNVDIDGFGACDGTLCCTTCHLIFKDSDYAKVGEPSDEEMDMLDLAYGLTETSRLGCQVKLRKDLDPLEVYVPASINDVRTS